MKNTLSAATIALLTLTGCGSVDASTQEPEPTASVFPGSSTKVEQFIQVINDETIISCETSSVDPREVTDEPSLRWDTITCDNNSNAYFTFSRASQDRILDTLEESEYPAAQTAYGDNWVFTGSQEQAEDIIAKLDGQHPDFPAFRISCSNEESAKSGEFSSHEDAWDELDEDDRATCRSAWSHADQVEAAELHEYTDTELEAIETAGYDDNGSITTLYGQCAASHLGDHEERKPWGEEQAQEIYGALVLCPDHPEREKVEQRIADAAKVEEQRESGERIGGGPHRVGKDIQPGTYVVEDEEGFEGCYWERLDASGNIIDNNFISSGFRAEVTVQESDYSFSARSCGEWVKQ